jgi:hypothetical protein
MVPPNEYVFAAGASVFGVNVPEDEQLAGLVFK